MATKSIVLLCCFVGLIAAGCVPAEECDEMGCTIPSERYVIQVDESVFTTPVATFDNPNGTNLVALGSSDTMGVVKLVPRRPQSYGGGTISPILVSARAPFIGHLDGTIDVFPLVPIDSTTYGTVTALRPILDIISFETQPTQAPVRAMQATAYRTTLNGSGNSTDSMYIKVTGRSRVRCTFRSLAGHSASAVITALAVGGTSTGYQKTLDSYAVTAASGAVEFSISALNGTGATLPPPGFGTIDYINFSFTSGTAADPINIDVQAWD
jgi:hypothetical protein